MSDAIFIPDGDLLIPQPTACGPWFPGVQHGGAITGLIARAIEQTPAAQPMMLTRLTVDMSRKVPMGPTKVEVEVVRDGKRVQALECRYVVDGEWREDPTNPTSAPGPTGQPNSILHVR